MIILAFSLCIGLFLFVYSMRRLEEDTLHFSQITLEQVSESITRMEADITSLTHSVSIRSEYQSLIYADSELTAYKRQNIASLQKELVQLVSSSNYISAIYIWFETPQLATTSSGMLKGTESIERNLNEQFGITLEQARSQVIETGSHAIYLSGSDLYAKNAYILAADGYNVGQADVIFIIKLNLSSVKGLLNSGSDTDSVFWAVSRQNSLLLVPDSAREAALALSTYTPNDASITRAYLDGNSYALLSNEENDSFILISAVDYRSYRQTISLYRLIFLLFLVTTLILGGILSFFLSHNNYQPVQDIRNKLSEYAPESESGNDFAILEMGIQSLLQKTRDYDQISSQARLQALDNFLSSLLLGSFHGDFQESCASFGLEFSSENFLVIGIAIQSYDNLFLNPASPQDRDLALYSVYSVIAEKLGGTYTVAVCHYERRIWAIVSFPSSSDSAALFTICDETERFLREELGIPTWIYLSNISSYPGAFGISKAYQEALWGLEQMEAYNMETPVLNEKGVLLQIDQTFHTAVNDQMQKQQEMLQAAIRGDYKEADRLYLEVRQQYTQYSFSLVRAQTMILIDYMVSFLPSVTLAENSQIIQSYRNHIYHETRDQQLIEFMHSFMICFHDIYQTVPQQVPDRMEVLALSAVQYINAHYTDPGIGVTQVAEQLFVSTSYLSKAFQKAYDTSIPDYIHQRRLNTACILLKESGITIEAVASQVGYTNSLALIRSFKRYKNCTPTEYRSTYMRSGQPPAESSSLH
ncbi:MAG: AraC family transcriptional regulator [Lachnospiraceae bacterium]|nr:AraC family transcriptional regulator [Lachnospiraceae bacterium]